MNHHTPATLNSLTGMKSFPFVLGTDIVYLPRWDPVRKPRVTLALARRILHPKEFGSVRHVNSNLHEALIFSGPFEKWHSSRSTNHAKRSEQDYEHEAHLFTERLDTISSRRVRNFLAGRWAAKEAARKAWGAHLLGFKDVRVVYDLQNRPGDHSDPSANAEIKSAGVKVISEPYYGPLGLNAEAIGQGPHQEGCLSISHDGDYVVGTVIAEPLTEQMRSLFEGRKSTSRPLGIPRAFVGENQISEDSDQDSNVAESDPEKKEVPPSSEFS